MSASQERRATPPERPRVASNAAMRFSVRTRSCREFPLPMRPLRVFLFHGQHDHGPTSTGIAGKLCGQDAKEPDSVQPVGFGAAKPRVARCWSARQRG